MPKRYASDQDRITQRVQVDEGGCWIWQGHLSPKGYGRINANYRVLFTHRLAYEAFVGPIPEGLQLDHLCRVRACCNPEHLEPVTALTNTRRSPISNANKTRCVNDHPYSELNAYLAPDGRRRCRICAREAVKRSRIREALRAAGIEVAA